MNVLDILNAKREQICMDGDVKFSGDELNILCDPRQLRAMKLYIDFPNDYSSCSRVEDCVDKIKQGDSIYRTLEYCILRNRALVSIKEVFPFFG